MNERKRKGCERLKNLCTPKVKMSIKHTKYIKIILLLEKACLNIEAF